MRIEVRSDIGKMLFVKGILKRAMILLLVDGDYRVTGEAALVTMEPVLSC